MLVDGTKEGAVVSVNGNIAQVSLWENGGAAVNVARLSPLEQDEIGPDLCDGCGRHRRQCNSDDVDSPALTDACKARRTRMFTLIPGNGGDVFEVHMGDVARWMTDHGPVEATDADSLIKAAGEHCSPEQAQKRIAWARKANAEMMRPAKNSEAAKLALLRRCAEAPLWLPRKDHTVQTILAAGHAFIAHVSGEHITLGMTYEGLQMLEANP